MVLFSVSAYVENCLIHTHIHRFEDEDDSEKKADSIHSQHGRKCCNTHARASSYKAIFPKNNNVCVCMILLHSTHSISLGLFGWPHTNKTSSKMVHGACATHVYVAQTQWKRKILWRTFNVRPHKQASHFVHSSKRRHLEYFCNQRDDSWVMHRLDQQYYFISFVSQHWTSSIWWFE